MKVILSCVPIWEQTSFVPNVPIWEHSQTSSNYLALTDEVSIISMKLARSSI